MVSDHDRDPGSNQATTASGGVDGRPVAPGDAVGKRQHIWRLERC